MKAQGGFTLVEGLVTGLISVIIPAVIISMLRMNNAQLAQTSTRNRLSLFYTVVTEEIHRSAAKAGRASKTSCADVAISVSVAEPNGVVFCDQSGNTTLSAFKVVASPGLPATIVKLQEWTIGSGVGAWRDFNIGEDPVLMEANPDAFQQKASGVFNIYEPPQSVAPGMQGVRFNLMLRMAIPGGFDYLPLQTESVVCRNVAPW
jgi:hypothetical protein